MKATHGWLGETPCVPWDGHPRLYQTRAAEALIYAGQTVTHFAWTTANCGTETCLEPTHLTAREPLRIAYPHGVCIYCGRHAATRDHLLPKPWTGGTMRVVVATVPACGTCNSLLADRLTWSITERRVLAHALLRKRLAKVLRVVDRTPEQLDEYGKRLRQHIVDGMADKAEVLRMLAWPEDPNYDARALERSGIPDPYALGLIEPIDAALLARVEGLVGGLNARGAVRAPMSGPSDGSALLGRAVGGETA